MARQVNLVVNSVSELLSGPETSNYNQNLLAVLGIGYWAINLFIKTRSAEKNYSFKDKHETVYGRVPLLLGLSIVGMLSGAV